jgi:hypothetical protein
MDLSKARRVRVSETRPIDRPTVTGLMEAFEDAFRGRDKPVRVLYTKGEDLIVERSVVSADPDPGEGSFATPYQMVRQHADLEIQESIDSSLLACCLAVQELRRQKTPVTFVVVQDKEQLSTWLPKGVHLGELFGADLFVDPEAPDACVFFCGSLASPMIKDVEKAICCRMV